LKIFAKPGVNKAEDSKHAGQNIGVMSMEERAKMGEQMKANEAAMAAKMGRGPGRPMIQQPAGGGGGQ
jgi:hypothetical protein